MALCRSYLQQWDVRSASRVDYFIANSKNVAAKIKNLYGRDAAVIYPPVDVEKFNLLPDLQPYYLIVSALVPYKRIDIAIDACRHLGASLKIVGRGPEEARLRARGNGAVEFLGWRSDEEIRDLYQHSTAVLLPGTEDFGMVPVEAQACGTPVVALGTGGACETVQDGVTGILVGDASVEAFSNGLDRVRSLQRDATVYRAHAEQFSRTRFMTNFRNAVIDAVAECEARS